MPVSSISLALLPLWRADFWGENTAGLVLSELEVQDLDTLTDWALAEMKYELLHK